MARVTEERGARKPREGRKKWNVLSTLDHERSEITKRAQMAEKSVSRYMIDAALGRSVTGRRDQLRIILLLSEIERQLETIAAPFRSATDFEQAVTVMVSLAEIEAAVLRIAHGADLDPASDSDEGDKC